MFVWVLAFSVEKKPLVKSLLVCILPVPLSEVLHTFSPAAAHRSLWSRESSCLIILFNGLYRSTIIPYSNALCEVPATRLSRAGRVSVFLAAVCSACACRGSGAISHPPLPVPHAESCFLCYRRNWPGRAPVTTSV